MSALIIPKPLILKDTTISWPYINPNSNTSPVYSLLVDKTDKNGKCESISLKMAYYLFHPKYGCYLKKMYSPQHVLYQDIWDYQNNIIETPIHYKYNVGQWGWLTNENTLEQSLVQIKAVSEYETEIFYLHEDLQKYHIQHYDIGSTEPKTLTHDEMEGTAHGWIIESIFTPIKGIIVAQMTENDEKEPNPLILELNEKTVMLNWKICREQYLIKKMNQMKLELTRQIDDRGILFRQTVQQWLNPIIKAFRGKITCNNVGNMIELLFHTPDNIWYYFLEPIFKEIYGMNDDEDFGCINNVISNNFSSIQLSTIIPAFKMVKLYDQFASAFKINSNIDVNIDEFEDIDVLYQALIQNMNDYAENRYKQMRLKNNDNLLIKKKVKFMITINGIHWDWNVNSGKSKFRANVYRISYLSNGTSIIHGKLDN